MALMIFDTAGEREMAAELARERGLELRPLWLRRWATDPLDGRRDVKADALVRGPFPSRSGSPALAGAARDLAEIARERAGNPLFAGTAHLVIEEDETSLFEGLDDRDAPRRWQTTPEGRALIGTTIAAADTRALLYTTVFALAWTVGIGALITAGTYLWPPQVGASGEPGAAAAVVARLASALALVVLAAFAASRLRLRYYRGLVRNPPKPSERALGRALEAGREEARWQQMAPQERTLEYMRNSGRAAAVFALGALPFAVGAFGLSIPAGTGGWLVAGISLLGLCAAYSLLGSSEPVRAFAYPERPGTAAIILLTVGLFCLLVVFGTWAASGGIDDLFVGGVVSRPLPGG